MSYVPLDGVRFGDSADMDAFMRLRVSQPTGLFAAQCQYDAEPLIYETGNTGTGVAPAHNSNTRMVALSVGTGTGTSFLQSFEYIPYQPGKSQLVFITGVIGAAVANQVVDLGYFDLSNGVFLRQNGTSGLQFAVRSSTSGSAVLDTADQADWNIDTFTPGSRNPSGITLDITKDMILVIDAQFLSMGRVRVGFNIDGVIYWAHYFKHANVIAVPYAQTLSLPIQMLITGTAAGGSKTSYFKCAAVASEGGFSDDIGYNFVTPDTSVSAASGARTHLVSLRPRTTFNGLTNRMKLRLDSTSILVTGANPIYWELCVGSTFSVAPTFNNVDGTYSGAEYGTGGTLSSAGIVIDSGYIASSNQSKGQTDADARGKYPITLNRAGAQRVNGTLSLIVTGISGASNTRASMAFSELR